LPLAMETMNVQQENLLSHNVPLPRIYTVRVVIEYLLLTILKKTGEDSIMSKHRG
jgi:hypothetical protein